MFVAFYQGKGTLFDKLIRWWTYSDYSHVEFVFSSGEWIGSSPRDGGVRSTFIEPVPGHWKFVWVPISEQQEVALKEWCLSQVGKKYDWVGIILSQIFYFHVQEPKKWFCSELCTAGLQRHGFLKGIYPADVHPGKLFSLLSPKE